MVNRKDFRPETKSYSLTERDRKIIRGTTQEHKEHPSLTKAQAHQVASDHLKENPEYYDKPSLETDTTHEMIKRAEKENKQYEPFEKHKLSEQEVNLLMRRINAKKIDASKVKHIEDGEGYELTDEQNEKGFKWLENQRRSPSGHERKNNPYGEREEAILDNKREIKLVDVYSERGNYYVPYYRVYSNDGDYFEYTVYGGQIHILG